MKVKASTKKAGLSRRRFLAASAAGAAGPLLLSRDVLGVPGGEPPSERPVCALIGYGGMGRGHMREGFHRYTAAVCEVDGARLDEALASLDGKAKGYTDYRAVLDRDDIDAVLIAAPDHWHAVMTQDACEAGKDVYCEKPACKTFEEGEVMKRAARRYDRVVQIGAQGRSTEGGWAACQFIRNGQLGSVHRVDIWHERNYSGGDAHAFRDPPANFDWDMWLGPAREHPYNPDYVHFNWRWMMDFGGGFIRDRGAHIMSIIQWALDLDHQWPRTIRASGKPQRDGLWDVPLGIDAVFEFPGHGLTVHWMQPGESRTGHPYGMVFHGSNGELVVEGGDGHCKPDEKALAYAPPADGYVPFRNRGTHRDHWLECIKSRERPNLDVAIGCDTANICNFALMSYVLQRPLEWDADAQQFVDDAQANRLLSVPGRGPWQLS